MDSSSLHETLRRLDSKLALLESNAACSGVDNFGLGMRVAHYQYREKNFIDIIKHLDDKIREVLDAVHHEKPELTMHVSMIHHAISTAYDSVYGLIVERHADWVKVADALKTLHETMEVLKIGAALLDTRMAGICQCVVTGTSVDDWDIFKSLPVHERNSKMLYILNKIGGMLKSNATTGGVFDNTYYNFLGVTGNSKMREIVRLLNN